MELFKNRYKEMEGKIEEVTEDNGTREKYELNDKQKIPNKW